MADVFISYAREDEARAEALANLLEANGLTVWWDRKLRGGTVFSKEIEKQIGEARKVVVIWSPRSAKADWVLEEAAMARRTNKLVPVRLDLPAEQLPLGFSLIHTLAWANELADWNEIFDALEHKRQPGSAKASTGAGPVAPNPTGPESSKSMGDIFADLFGDLGKPRGVPQPGSPKTSVDTGASTPNPSGPARSCA